MNQRFKMGYGVNLNNVNLNLEQIKLKQKRLLQTKIYQQNQSRLQNNQNLEQHQQTTNLDINDVYEVISNGKPPKPTISPYFKDYEETAKIKEANSSDSD